MWFRNAKRIDVWNVRMLRYFLRVIFFTKYCNGRRRHVNVNSKNGYEEIKCSNFFSLDLKSERKHHECDIAFWKLEYVTISVSSFDIGQWYIFFYLEFILGQQQWPEAVPTFGRSVHHTLVWFPCFKDWSVRLKDAAYDFPVWKEFNSQAHIKYLSDKRIEMDKK